MLNGVRSMHYTIYSLSIWSGPYVANVPATVSLTHVVAVSTKKTNYHVIHAIGFTQLPTLCYINISDLVNLVDFIIQFNFNIGLENTAFF